MNNHVLDFGSQGLLETLESLRRAGLKTAGAGRDVTEAGAPAIIDLCDGGRVLIFAFGHSSGGIPRNWAAGTNRPGVSLLPDFSECAVAGIAQRVSAVRRDGDMTIASIHWGGNWGYAIAEAQRRFAHRLIDVAGFDLVHGHSSHHPRPLEIYRGRLILYGCSDFLNDYEGIAGYEEFRGELSLMYLPRLCVATGRLIDLRMVPFRIARFRLYRASDADAAWLRHRLDAVSQPFGVSIDRDARGDLWAGASGSHQV